MSYRRLMGIYVVGLLTIWPLLISIAAYLLVGLTAWVGERAARADDRWNHRVWRVTEWINDR